MILKDIEFKELLQLMHEYDVSEVSLTDGKNSVSVKRGMSAQATLPAQPAGFSTQKTEPEVETIPKETAQEPPKEDDNYYKVKAPLVGTFYRASSPEADPFVEVGDRVHTGDVLCIVEAMKSMNEIQSDVNGLVKEICIENTELVEFEQVLFKIDTSG